MRLYAYWDAFVLKGPGVNNFDNWVDLTLKSVRECQKRHGDTLWPPPDTNACDEDTIEGVAAGLYAHQLAYWFKKVRRRFRLAPQTSSCSKDEEGQKKKTEKGANPH